MGLLGTLLKVGGTAIGAVVGGPTGASIGASIGGAVGGAVDQSSAAKKATKAQRAAEAAADARRQEALKKVEALQAPGVQAYNTGLNALTGRLGLASSTPTTPTAIGATPAAGSMTSQQAQAILADRPDVANSAWLNSVDPSVIGDRTGDGKVTQDDRAAWWQTNYGTPEGYQAPRAATSPVENPNALTGQPTTAAQATGNPGTYGNALSPTYTAPEAYSYGLDDYKASPAYAYQLDQALKGTEATAAVTGSLRSGAAAKALQDRAQNMALSDFNNERQFDYGAYTDKAKLDRSNYENDRNYLSSRYDQGTSDLFRYTGVGQNALTTTSNAEQGYGSDAAQTALNQGQITSSNALAQGNIWSGLTSNLGGIISSAVQGAGTGASAGSNTVPYDPSMVNVSYKTPPINPLKF